MKFIKEKLFGKGKKEEVSEVEGIIELIPEEEPSKTAKIVLRYYTLSSYEDIKPILDNIREGYTIALIKISPLRDKDINELKRAIEKLKKTVSAIEGDIVGIDEDYIVVTPSYVMVTKG